MNQYHKTRLITLQDLDGLPMKSRQDDIQKHVNREEELRWGKHGAYSPLPNHTEYLEEIGRKYILSKVLYYKL